jgi:hypothetical protein
MLLSTSTSRKMSPIAMTTVDRPLSLGELLAETVRLYGERFWAALSLGVVYTAAVAGAAVIHEALYYLVAAFMVAAAYAGAARLAAGDSFAEAWAQVALRLPVVLVLALVVGLPFVLATSYLVFFLIAAAWIGLTGFAIPVAMLERENEKASFAARIAYALERAITLARTELLHAAGVAAALVCVNLLLGIVLAGALAGYGENSETIAGLLAQLVLVPFFFFGLSILYFEQKARAVSSPRPRN